MEKKTGESKGTPREGLFRLEKITALLSFEKSWKLFWGKELLLIGHRTEGAGDIPWLELLGAGGTNIWPKAMPTREAAPNKKPRITPKEPLQLPK